MFFAVFYFILTFPLSFPSNIIQDMSLHSALLFNTPTSILSGSTQKTCNEPGQSAISNKNLNICCTLFLHSTLLFNTPTSILSGSTQQTCNEPGQFAISNKNLSICYTFFLHSTLLFNTSSALSQDQLSKLTMKLPNLLLFISMLLHICVSSGLHTILLFMGIMTAYVISVFHVYCLKLVAMPS